MGEEDLAIDLESLIAAARAEFDEAEPQDVDVLLGAELVKVRLWPLAPQAWRVLYADNPVRVKVVDGERVERPSDVPYGCDIDTVVREYPRVALVQSDDVKELDRETWKRIVDVLPLDGLQGVMATIAYMNIAEPAQRLVEALGKAVLGEGQTKPASPDSSE